MKGEPEVVNSVGHLMQPVVALGVEVPAFSGVRIRTEGIAGFSRQLPTSLYGSLSGGSRLGA